MRKISYRQFRRNRSHIFFSGSVFSSPVKIKFKETVEEDFVHTVSPEQVAHILRRICLLLACQMNLKGTVEEEFIFWKESNIFFSIYAVSSPVKKLILKRQKWKIPTVVPEKGANIFSAGLYFHHLSNFKGQKRGLGLKFRYRPQIFFSEKSIYSKKG